MSKFIIKITNKRAVMGFFLFHVKDVFECERVFKVQLKCFLKASKLIVSPSQRPVAQSCAHPAESVGK